MKFLARLALIVLFLSLGLSKSLGQSLSVVAVVKDTAIIFSGYTAPNSLITIIENSIVIGTTSSDANGLFSKYLNSDAGIHTISISSNNPGAGLMPTIEFDLALLSHQEMTIGNIYMPASLQINSSTFLNNDSIEISGYAKPNSQIEVTISGNQNIVNIVSTDSSGYYVLNIPADSMQSGSYQVSTKLLISGIIDNSTISGALSFSVTIITPTITSTPSISMQPTSAPSGPSSTPRPGTTDVYKCQYEYENICYFDKDDFANLVSKEAFLEYLDGFIKYSNNRIDNENLPMTGGVDLPFDINQDGQINATDLSIMLYYWKGDNGILKYFVSQSGIADTDNTNFPIDDEAKESNIFTSSLVVVSLLVLSVVSAVSLTIFVNPKNPKIKQIYNKLPFLRSIMHSSLAAIVFLSILSMSVVIIESKYIFNFDIIDSIGRRAFLQAEFSIEKEFDDVTNNSVIFDIYVNTSQPINLVQTDLEFDSRIFNVKAIQTGSSFANIVTRNEYSNKEGWISIVAGLPNPGFLGKGLVARVILERKNPGICNIRFLSTSKAFANDGKGTNILLSSVGTSINIE